MKYLSERSSGSQAIFGNGVGMTEELRKQAIKLAEHLEGMSGVNVRVLDCDRREVYGEAPFCTVCGYCAAHIPGSCRYACIEAYRWGGQYISYCAAGVVFAASPLIAKGEMIGGLVMGPMVMGDPEDVMEPREDLRRAIREELPSYSTARVRHCSEVLAALAEKLTGSAHPVGIHQRILPAREIYENAPEGQDGARYFLDCERQLRAFVASFDRNGAQTLLNDLLGYIYFSCNFELSIIKSRVLELIVVLSRAVIDAGADKEEILQSNTQYFARIESFTNIEEMSVWLTDVMHHFMLLAFDPRRMKHSDAVHRIIKYIQSNYQRRITLDDVAGQVFLSRSYISSLFKEETGTSLTSYINHVRIEESKRLLEDDRIPLVDIADMCGFGDQSYFTKIFKRETGMPPNRYRALFAGVPQDAEDS